LPFIVIKSSLFERLVSRSSSKSTTVTIPESHKVDGQELTKLFAGKSSAQHRDVFLNHYPHPRRGQSHFFTTWRNGDWKVIYEYFKSGDDRYSLYNLKDDISESSNLTKSHQDKLKSMMQEMVNELNSMNAIYPNKDGLELKVQIP
jgi:arylsulfatase A-like enzyme